MDKSEQLIEAVEALKTELKDRVLSDDVVESVSADVGRLLTKLKECPPSKKHSVLELQGLGKEFWRSIDVEEYLRKERDSWG
jgi:hypothetical protein